MLPSWSGTTIMCAVGAWEPAAAGCVLAGGALPAQLHCDMPGPLPEGRSPNTSARARRCPRLVPLDQLCLSSQCGFSSTVEGNVLTTEEQAAKLRLIVQVTADVWG
jgi:hypothetical protein